MIRLFKNKFILQIEVIRKIIVFTYLFCNGTVYGQSSAVTSSVPALQWTRGEKAYVVAVPKTLLEKRVVKRLSDYLFQVLHSETKVVTSLSNVPGNLPAILLSPNSMSKANAGASPEAFTIETSVFGKHPVVLLSGNSALGLKHAVQRLLIKS